MHPQIGVLANQCVHGLGESKLYALLLILDVQLIRLMWNLSMGKPYHSTGSELLSTCNAQQRPIKTQSFAATVGDKQEHGAAIVFGASLIEVMGILD
jgi:hypothetical protein